MWAPEAGEATGAAGYPTGEMAGFYLRGFEASRSERQDITTVTFSALRHFVREDAETPSGASVVLALSENLCHVEA